MLLTILEIFKRLSHKERELFFNGFEILVYRAPQLLTLLPEEIK